MNPAADDSTLPDLKWPALAAHWAVLAKASVKLPDDTDGRRWRGAVPSIIALQAVTLALQDLQAALHPDAPLYCDRAGHLIDEHSAKILRLWTPDPPPTPMIELIDDARTNLATTRKLLGPSSH